MEICPIKAIVAVILSALVHIQIVHSRIGSQSEHLHQALIRKSSVMLEPYINQLNNLKIVLASSSPRRSQLLKSIGLKFEVIPSDFDESSVPVSKFKNYGDFVSELAYKKAMEVSDLLREENHEADLIIGADTIVTINDMVLGKPKDEEEAKEFLSKLSGNTHSVFTGVAILSKGRNSRFSNQTEVTFSKLTPEVISAYVKTGEPLDKAGAYGIQGKGGSLIEKVSGDPFNVVGFPLSAFCTHLIQDVLPLPTGN
uniref:N-acetylserotonin O-methyltransferase-like protein n=2 Tax=Cacopsylla melanoneura TaxID=428564 RepID=A0A8D8RCD4_9HEMI